MDSVYERFTWSFMWQFCQCSGGSFTAAKIGDHPTESLPSLFADSSLGGQYSTRELSLVEGSMSVLSACDFGSIPADRIFDSGFIFNGTLQKRLVECVVLPRMAMDYHARQYCFY